MATKKFDAVATVGKYKDCDGNEKKRYLTVGAVFEDDQGRMSLKIEAVPVGAEWNGWISFYAPQQREGQQRQERPAQSSKPTAPSGSFNDFDDDLPF